jgi:hypothetical protein
VTQQGLNVVYFTTETLRPQVRIKILSRHSRLPAFGLERGLNSRDIKAGSLTPAGEGALAEVIRDFSSNPGYGRCYIAQVARGATISQLSARLELVTRLWTADLVVVDYLALLRAEAARRDLREQLSEIIKDGKQLAATYRDGLGVPLISPWQMSREGWKAARPPAGRGFYTLADLGDTHEASATADTIITLLEDDGPGLGDDGGRRVRLRAGLLKNRDGERHSGDNSVSLTADYATSWFSAGTAGSSPAEDMLPGSASAPFG